MEMKQFAEKKQKAKKEENRKKETRKNSHPKTVGYIYTSMLFRWFLTASIFF